jgi:hypothetical protein
MPTVNLPQATELSGEVNINNLYKSYMSLYDNSQKLRKELSFLMNNLDEENVLVAQKAMIAELYAGTVTTDQLVAGTAKIGSALIETLTVGGNVQIGSAQDAAGVTTIIGNTITTTYVNALNITATNVAAENISGTTITGKAFQTAATGQRIKINTITTGPAGQTNIEFYNASSQLNGVMFVSGTDFNMYSLNGDMYLGIAGRTTYANGPWYFSGNAYMGGNLLATQSYVAGLGYITAAALSGYATQSYVTSQGYITASSSAFIKANTGGSKTIDYITASAFGISVHCTDSTVLNFAV